MTERQPPDNQVEKYHLWTQDDRRVREGASVAYVIIGAAVFGIAAAIVVAGAIIAAWL